MRAESSKYKVLKMVAGFGPLDLRRGKRRFVQELTLDLHPSKSEANSDSGVMARYQSEEEIAKMFGPKLVAKLLRKLEPAS